MIRYLEKDEYYFGKKISDSQVIVKEDEGGKLLTMAHLNPYKVRVGGRMYVLPYIVGVATAADSRHQGHMRDVLAAMLQDMHEAHTPFCYLMPASPDIYRPFGFVYIFDQPVWTLREDAAKGMQVIGLRLDGAAEAAGEEGVEGWVFTLQAFPVFSRPVPAVANPFVHHAPVYDIAAPKSGNPKWRRDRRQPHQPYIRFSILLPIGIQRKLTGRLMQLRFF